MSATSWEFELTSKRGSLILTEHVDGAARGRTSQLMPSGSDVRQSHSCSQPRNSFITHCELHSAKNQHEQGHRCVGETGGIHAQRLGMSCARLLLVKFDPHLDVRIVDSNGSHLSKVLKGTAHAVANRQHGIFLCKLRQRARSKCLGLLKLCEVKPGLWKSYISSLYSDNRGVECTKFSYICPCDGHRRDLATSAAVRFGLL